MRSLESKSSLRPRRSNLLVAALVSLALAMLFGNDNKFSWSLFAPGNTLASLIANQWPEAAPPEKSALLYAGLVLLVITLLINIVGTLIIMRTAHMGEKR